MPYQLTDINIIRSDLEKKLGKEELEKAIKNIYNRDYIKKITIYLLKKPKSEY